MIAELRGILYVIYSRKLRRKENICYLNNSDLLMQTKPIIKVKGSSYLFFKGSDRICQVVELSMCSVVENFFRIHLRNIKLFKDL